MSLGNGKSENVMETFVRTEIQRFHASCQLKPTLRKYTFINIGMQIIDYHSN